LFSDFAEFAKNVQSDLLIDKQDPFCLRSLIMY